MDITRNNASFVARTTVLNDYLREISAYKCMTASEERELFEKYFASTDEKEKAALRDEIINRNQRFVYAIAKRYNNTDRLMDLIQEGNFGLLVAFGKYDMSHDNRFCSFAVWHIRRQILDFLSNEGLMVRPTNNVRVAPKVKKFNNEYFLKNGRYPSAGEVIDMLWEKYQIPITDEGDIYGARIDYIDAAFNDDDDAETFEQSSLYNEKTASLNDFEAKIDSESANSLTKAALTVLNERELTIVSMAAGIGYDRTYKNNEIGDAIGLTAERVRQIKNKAFEKMKTVYLSENA